MGELHDFAERGDLDEVRRLLDSGVPVDALDEGDETALHGAAAFGHTEVLQLLLERGAAVDQTDDDQFQTALMTAAGNGHLGAVEVLLEHGADCNAADDYGETVLVRAAGSGNAQLVLALLAAGADPSQPGELSRLPHEEAEHLGFSEVADLLRTALHAKRQ
jgi:serine/threonine-protein phosphatase 6 regulatory ankyrin repeat subunit B